MSGKSTLLQLAQRFHASSVQITSGKGTSGTQQGTGRLLVYVLENIKQLFILLSPSCCGVAKHKRTACANCYNCAPLAFLQGMLVLQYELESKATKWYATTDSVNGFFSISLAAQCRPKFALKQGEAPQHLQYTDTSCGATQQRKFLRTGRK